MPTKPRPRIGRKLLVATIGVATVTYVACNDETSVGNLMPYPQQDSSVSDSPVGNLVAPDVQNDVDQSDSPVGNLIAPPVDAGDAGDGGDADGGG